MILRSVGIAGAIVVGMAALAALTLLPAGLALIGPSLERFSIRRRGACDRPATPAGECLEAAPGEAVTAGRWERLAERVMDHPWRVFVPTLALLLLLGAPFLHVRFNAPDATILPADVASRTSYDILAREFGEGEFAPLILAVRTDGAATDPANVALLYDWSRRLAARPADQPRGLHRGRRPAPVEGAVPAPLRARRPACRTASRRRPWRRRRAAT